MNTRETQPLLELIFILVKRTFESQYVGQRFTMSLMRVHKEMDRFMSDELGLDLNRSKSKSFEFTDDWEEIRDEDEWIENDEEEGDI